MMKKYLIVLTLGVFTIGFFLFSWSTPVNASPEIQLTSFPTPTPDGDGRIWYRVESLDTLWRISAVSGVSLDELRRLNNMSADDVLAEGSIILLGINDQNVPVATPGDSGQEIAEPTETPPPDTGSAIICILKVPSDVEGEGICQLLHTGARWGLVVAIQVSSGSPSGNSGKSGEMK